MSQQNPLCFSVLRAVASREMDVDWSLNEEVTHVERDGDDFVTVYGTERFGQLHYLVLNQALIDKLKTI